MQGERDGEKREIHEEKEEKERKGRYRKRERSTEVWRGKCERLCVWGAGHADRK